KLDAAPRPAAAAVDLALLERERYLVAAGVAGDQPQLGAEHVLQHGGENVGIRSGAFAGDREGSGQRVVPALDLGTVPGRANADLVAGAAEPSEFARVELGVACADQ